MYWSDISVLRLRFDCSIEKGVLWNASEVVIVR